MGEGLGVGEGVTAGASMLKLPLAKPSLKLKLISCLPTLRLSR